MLNLFAALIVLHLMHSKLLAAKWSPLRCRQDSVSRVTYTIREKIVNFMNKKAQYIFFRERNLSLLTFYFQNVMKGINIHQKSKKLQILMAKGWNISFWVKNMEGQVFAKIFHCAGPNRD